MRSVDDLDAVTIDALGTLVELEDPVPELQAALAARGIARSLDEVADAFAAEAAYYRSRLGEPGPWNDAAVARLRRDCAQIFLAVLAAPLDADLFAPAFVEALRFRLVERGSETLEALKAGGLRLACVSNWDPTLHEVLADLRVARFFDAVVTSAETGATKPDPQIFRVALARLGVEPARALHVGDGDVDREGALAAGLAFEPAPLVTLPKRLGLG